MLQTSDSNLELEPGAISLTVEIDRQNPSQTISLLFSVKGRGDKGDKGEMLIAHCSSAESITDTLRYVSL